MKDCALRVRRAHPHALARLDSARGTLCWPRSWSRLRSAVRKHRTLKLLGNEQFNRPDAKMARRLTGPKDDLSCVPRHCKGACAAMRHRIVYPTNRASRALCREGGTIPRKIFHTQPRRGAVVSIRHARVREQRLGRFDGPWSRPGIAVNARLRPLRWLRHGPVSPLWLACWPRLEPRPGIASPWPR